MKKSKWSLCSVNNSHQSSMFTSQQTNKSYTILHEVHCSSAFIIYLMKFTSYKKHYLGKSETSFNIRLNDNCKDVNKPDAILTCRHFQERKKMANKHTKFIIIDTFTNTIKSKI